MLFNFILYKPILQNVVLDICAHSKYPNLKELKEGVLRGFHNESRVTNKNLFWQQIRSEVNAYTCSTLL